MHARSAACIGCSGSMASGTPALRASGRMAAMPSRTWFRAPIRSFEPGGSPPTTSTRHCAPSSCASSIARRLSSRQSLAVKKPPRHRPVTTRLFSRMAFFALLQAHLRHLVAPGRDAADAVARAAVDHLREVPLLAHGRRVERQLHHSVPGGNSFGRNSGICGQMMTSASTTSIGISMIITSFSASTMRILATAQEIIRHRP